MVHKISTRVCCLSVWHDAQRRSFRHTTNEKFGGCGSPRLPAQKSSMPMLPRARLLGKWSGVRVHRGFQHHRSKARGYCSWPTSWGLVKLRGVFVLRCNKRGFQCCQKAQQDTGIVFSVDPRIPNVRAWIPIAGKSPPTVHLLA